MKTAYVIRYRGLDGNGDVYLGLIKVVSRLEAAMPYISRSQAEKDLESHDYADAQHGRGEVATMNIITEQRVLCES